MPSLSVTNARSRITCPSLYCWDSSVAYSCITNKQNMDIKYFSPQFKVYEGEEKSLDVDLGKGPGPLPLPLILDEKEEITEGGKPDRTSKRKMAPNPAP